MSETSCTINRCSKFKINIMEKLAIVVPCYKEEAVLAETTKRLSKLLDELIRDNQVSEENIKKIEILDDYVIEHFRIAFGNRIVKQLRDFVPAYVGCGGTEIDGLDYVLARKVFRKFESLNLSYIRDEIDGLCAYIDELFGEENMGECKSYLRMLKKLV